MTRRVGLILAEVATLVLVVALAGAALLVFGLSGRQIDAGLLREPAERAFASAFSDQYVRIGGISSEWSADERAVVVTATDVTILDAEGQELAHATRLAAALPAFSLLRRQFRPVRIEAEGGAFTLLRDVSGRVRLHVGPPESSVADALPQGAAGMPELSRLRGLHLSRVTLHVVDSIADLRWRIEDAGLDYAGADGEAHGGASGRLVQPGGDAMLSARVQARRTRTEIDIDITGLNGAHSAPRRGAMALLSALDADASASLRAVLAQDRLQSVTLRAEAGEGRLVVGDSGGDGDGDSGIALHAAVIAIDFDVAQRRATLREARIDSSRAVLAARGHIEGPVEDGGFLFDLEFNEPVFRFGDADPAAADWATVRGRFMPSGRMARLDLLEAGLGPMTARMSGSAGLAPGPSGRLRPVLSLTGPLAGESSPQDVLRFWPAGFADGGRDWIEANVEAGRIHDAHVTLDLSPEKIEAGVLTDEMLTITFRVEGGRARYLADLPPVTEAAGAAVLHGNSFSMTLDSGRIGDITLDSGAVEIPRLFPRGALARIAGRARGSVTDMLTLLDYEPLGFPGAFGVDPDSVSGEGVMEFSVWRPMRRSVAARRVGFSVEGVFEDVAAPGPLPDFPITDGRVTLRATPQGMVASGPARIGPVEAVVEWRQDFFSGDAPGTRFDISGALDQADFDALGAPLRAFVDGPVPVRIQTVGNGLDIQQADLRVDLGPAALDVGAWRKPAGAPGEARLTLERDGETGEVRLENAGLTGPGLDVAARALLGPDGRLMAAEIAPLRLEGYADLDRIVAGREGETLRLSLAGRHMDASQWVSGLSRGAAGGVGVPLLLDAQIDRLSLGPEAELTEALLSLSHDGEMLTTLTLDALADGRPVDARLLPTGGAVRTFDAHAEDAGLLVRTLFGARGVRGGTLHLTGASSEPGAPWLFEARMNNFTVTQAPILARILSLASLGGLAETLGGEGMSFSEFQARAALANGRLTISEGRAVGASLGVTVNGEVDLSRQALALNGAVAPAMFPNHVLGDVLGARPGEGLFAFSYTASGPFSGATVLVNPLSGLAPGFLRRLFETGAQLPPDEE